MHNTEHGIMIKSPFTTNKYGFHFKVWTKQDVIKKLNDICASLYSGYSIDKARVPYMLIQPFMKNTKEYKVACYAGKFEYIVSSASHHYVTKDTRAFTMKPHTRLRIFVEEAIASLRTNCPYAIAHGVLRVDVFETEEVVMVPANLVNDKSFHNKWLGVDEDGRATGPWMFKWVVNEFESFEADVGGTSNRQLKIQGLQQKFMEDQVEQSILKMIERYPS